MDSPKRKAQKNKDYRRHRMMRLLNRRKATAQEAMSEIAERELMRRLRITPLKKFRGGKDVDEEDIEEIRPPMIPFKQKEEVIITPDREYNKYLNTLPDNQRFTPNEEYDSYLYW